MYVNHDAMGGLFDHYLSPCCVQSAAGFRLVIHHCVIGEEHNRLLNTRCQWLASWFFGKYLTLLLKAYLQLKLEVIQFFRTCHARLWLSRMNPRLAPSLVTRPAPFSVTRRKRRPGNEPLVYNLDLLISMLLTRYAQLYFKRAHAARHDKWQRSECKKILLQN